ncbi:DUF6049 family protein [Cellulomonas denverensis]|uniref:Uncharacterized protein n=1 Tax=Cellulomonas denverensis TaxID=264297 RepID=A0A7X6KYB5_9CELL|nr:DUF6049 family protein [Cellulomonas denverensis]NKY24419.1 hypothetical protein [Cellulomonas denverensis]GIG26603.1 hypothetical protein Cde04nite_28470 [Cellulomonas denverensis]
MRLDVPRRRWSALLLSVLTLAVLTGLVASPAVAAPSTDDLPVAVGLSSISPQVLTPGEDLTVTVNLRNNGDEEITSPRASVRIYRYRISTRDQLDTWSASGDTGPYGDVAATEILDEPLPPGGTATVTITVPARSIGLSRSADAWGPRGLTVDVSDNGDRVGIERSFLLWNSDEDVTATHVSVLTPVTGPAVTPPAADEEEDEDAAPTPAPTASPTEPTADATDSTDATDSGTGDDSAETGLDALTSAGGRLNRLLQATSGHDSVSWAIDPALLDQVSTGSRADRAWADSLTAAGDGREVFRLPWADPDLAALAHSGRSSSADLLSQALDSSAAATDSVLDGADSLLWGSNPELDQATVDLAAGHAAGAALIAGTESMPADDPDTASAPVTVSGVTTLVPDAGLSELLTDPDAVQAGSTPAVAAQRMLAETAVIARGDDSGGSYVLITTPRDWSPNTEATNAQLSALESAPWVETTSVTDLVAAQAAGRVSGSDRAPLPEVARDSAELTPAWVNALSAGWEAAEEFASVVADPQALLSGLDGDVLAPLSVAWRADPDGRAEAVGAALDQASARQSGLSVLLNEQFTVISSSSQITVTVRNELAQDATVRVELRPQIELRPQKGCLETARSPLVSVGAESETPVVLSLRATANCDVTVDVSLTAENGRELAMPATFDARVAPTVESVGTIVVGALLAAGLVFGIWRTVRRGQTTRRGARVLADGAGETTGKTEDDA